MKTSCLILLWYMTINLIAQPYVDTSSEELKIYNANELINIGKNNGMQKLAEKINPIDLLNLDRSYASALIAIEFKTGFIRKHDDNKKVYTYVTPDVTMELADKFDDKRAGEKLFEYYCKLPKFIKSDTIYFIYNNLDDYLKILIKFKSPRIIERLKKDYYDWSILAKKAPKKVYPTIEQRKASIDEWMRFKPSDLYIDCNFITLQLACALNRLNVNGFEYSLIEKLKKRQTWPYASTYSFPSTLVVSSNTNDNPNNKWSKIIKNKSSITNFRTNLKKIEKLLEENFEYCCGSKIYEIIEDGSRAYVTVSRSNGSEYYRFEIRKDATIKIDLMSMIIE